MMSTNALIKARPFITERNPEKHRVAISEHLLLHHRLQAARVRQHHSQIHFAAQVYSGEHYKRRRGQGLGRGRSPRSPDPAPGPLGPPLGLQAGLAHRPRSCKLIEWPRTVKKTEKL